MGCGKQGGGEAGRPEKAPAIIQAGGEGDLAKKGEQGADEAVGFLELSLLLGYYRGHFPAVLSAMRAAPSQPPRRALLSCWGTQGSSPMSSLVSC